jgi:hypothetical protein
MGYLKKNQNPRIVRSGYLKNVKEFSGFFKASEGLTVCRRLLDYFTKLRTTTIYNNWVYDFPGIQLNFVAISNGHPTPV